MHNPPIYFEDDRWDKLQTELSQIKNLLVQVLRKMDQPSTGEEQLLSARQVAQWLAVDVATVYARCANNMIPHSKIGKQYKFSRGEIEDYITNSKKEEDINVDEIVNRYLQNKILKG